MSDSERKNSPGIKDISTFVENYERLLHKLFPVFAVWDAAVYVVRWENYLLTLGVILVLSLLLYCPALLFSLLTLSAILVMGVGRYHGQTKATVALRRPPAVELLDSNQQALKKQHSEQKHMHKLRAEYRQILSNAESYILAASKFMDYVNRVYLWKSPEISLCVTVLLCVLLVLLCTVSLRTIGAALPIIVLCTNKYFFTRNVDIFKQSVIRLQLQVQNWKRKRKQPKFTENGHHERGVDMEPPVASDSDVVVQDTARSSEESSVDVSDTASGRTEHQRPVLSELRHRGDRTHLQHQASVEQLANPGVGGEGAGGTESAVGLEGESSTSHAGGIGGSGTPQLLKKDATPLEYCSNCKASFAKLLKRKHDCSKCGQSFCGSCTVKVKRAALGATSPAAFEESVRVCLTCKTVLDQWADSSSGENSSTVRK